MESIPQIEEKATTSNNDDEDKVQKALNRKVFRDVVLTDFTNYKELVDAAHDLDDEKKNENVEMTEQEIEAL